MFGVFLEYPEEAIMKIFGLLLNSCFLPVIIVVVVYWYTKQCILGLSTTNLLNILHPTASAAMATNESK